MLRMKINHVDDIKIVRENDLRHYRTNRNKIYPL